MTDKVSILDADVGPELPLVDGPGRAWAVVWPGVGAVLRSMHRISLPAEGSTRVQRHDGEAVYYAIKGGGRAENPTGSDGQDLDEGTMIHIGPDTEYVFRAGASGLELVGGPSPADFSLYEGIEYDPIEPGDASPAAGAAPGGVKPGIHRFHRDHPDQRIPMVASDARLVVWAGTGSETANMNYVDMEIGEENVPHSHGFSEDTIFILSGKGTISDLANGVDLEFEAGQVIHVPVGLEHQVRGDRGTNVVSVGGPCPADAPMLKAAGVL